ncbi:choice-of-anchor I family protein [Acinetobacter sp.]|uniref:choice-of-anchor I family protein n=1 Tax=Acinetobacter sp. TaxID=472 RepID=UPI0035B1F7C5
MSLSVSMLFTACNDDDNASGQPEEQTEITPERIELSLLGRYASGVFAESSAEITAFDPESKRIFTVNAKKGLVDVLDGSDMANLTHIGELSARAVLADSEVNSVAVHNGIVALAVQAPTKTDTGLVAFYKASDLSFISSIPVGALPDMLTFSPDGKSVLVANEGEPNDGYTIDPEGSISIIDVTDISKPTVRTADFKSFNDKKMQLTETGVRIYGPNASVAQDLEPEYITISSDSKTAWVTLQENNALAKVDLATATVTDVLPLGFKDHGVAGQGIDASDDGVVNIQTWAGVYGVYMPDAITSYDVDGLTYLVTANEGDAREWISDEDAYYNGDTSKGFMDELRMKHLVHKEGFAKRIGNDMPAQLNALAKGAKLDSSVFGYCGSDCREDEQLGRLNIIWNMGYLKNTDGSPILDENGYMTYNKLYSFGGRSFSIWDEHGVQVWDSKDQIEQTIAKELPALFNSDHESIALDDRSDNKGPEPEGLTVGKIGEKTFVFVGLERVGGVMVYDISNPKSPEFIQYINTRKVDATEEQHENGEAGDLGPEGLTFVSGKKSPTGMPLLIVGNEVSGTTAVYQITLK